MSNIDNYTPVTKLKGTVTQADIVSKLNELIDVLNDLVPKFNGEDGIVEEED